MDKKRIQDFWLYSNAVFVVNYILLILSIFIAFPVPRLPSYFNNIFLILAYALTFHSLVVNFKAQDLNTLFSKITSQPNTFCLAFFITFPPNLLLSPFFLLSVYHITSAVLSRKKEFENYFFYSACSVLGKNLSGIGRFALLSELLLVPVCVVLLFLGKIRIFTLIAYVSMVRKQYQTNKAMKDVFDECMHNVHSFFLKLPDSYKSSYLQALGSLQKLFKKEEDTKKKVE